MLLFYKKWPAELTKFEKRNSRIIKGATLKPLGRAPAFFPKMRKELRICGRLDYNSIRSLMEW